MLKRGPRGHDGHEGHRGMSGAKGATGPTGPAGHRGRSGVAGAAGAVGPTGATGATGPSGTSFVPAFGFAQLTNQQALAVTGPTAVPFSDATVDPLGNITYSGGTNSFLVGITGTYAIDYFVQLYHDVSTPAGTTFAGPPVTIGVSLSGATPNAADELIPTVIAGAPWTESSFPYNALSTGTYHVVQQIGPGTSVKLQILAIPSTTGPSGADVPTFFSTFDPNVPSKVNAYLSIYKID